MSQPALQNSYQDEYQVDYQSFIATHKSEESFFTLLKRHWHDVFDLDSWRMLFSILRLVINASFSFLVFYKVSGLPLFISLLAGFIIGMSSATVQFFNEGYTKWIGRGSILAQIFKWYLVEVVFLWLPYMLVFVPFNIKLHGQGWGIESVSLLWAALLSMLSQGVWELAIVYRKKQKFGVNSENLNRLKVIYKFRFLVVSCFSVFCAVLNLVNPMIGAGAFAIYAASGFVYCMYLWLDHKLRQIAASRI